MPHTAQLSDLLLRWQELRDQGQPTPAEELCGDVPELLEPLRQEIERLQGSDRGAPTVTTGALTASSAQEQSTDTEPDHPTIAGYQVLGVLGSGGMGVVYKARQVNLGRLVALKTVRAEKPPQPSQLQRFEREMRAAARLNHAHIVPIYEVGQYSGRPFYTMPYLPGGNLAQHRQALLRDPRSAVALVEKVARAVQHAHEQGVLHRDLKPSNVFLNERREPLVGDFGLAKLVNSDLELTETGAVLGTPGYMAPEQVRGRVKEVGPATDVWALGVMLYELLAGHRPFTGENSDEVRWKIATEGLPTFATRPGVTTSVLRIVRKCLEKEPARRYASAGELADALANYLRTAGPADQTEGADPRPAALLRRRWWTPPFAACLALVLAAGLAGGAAWWFTSSAGPGDEPPESLQAGPPPQVLLDTQGPVEQWYWPIETTKVNVTQAADKSFFVDSPGLGLLELLAKPPGPSFRLQAKIRHHQTRGGQVGLAFSYHRFRVGPDDHHGFGKLVFSDKGKLNGWTHLMLAHCPCKAPIGIHEMACVFPRQTPASQPPNEWRTLKIEVTPLEIRAYLNGDCFARQTTRQMESLGASLLRGVADNGHLYDPQGGLGLYIEEGSAFFKNVTVTLLP